jgi:hypothetical protein
MSDGTRSATCASPPDGWRASSGEGRDGRVARSISSPIPRAGLVARAYLEGYATSWDQKAPRVDHLVTFATPHQGAPPAGEIGDLQRSLTGELALRALSRWSEPDGVVPDPDGASLRQLMPGSAFLAELAEEDVLYGTRVLTLAMPFDVIVPADHARYPGQLNRVVPGEGWAEHRTVVASPVARGLARAFLRDAPEPCRSIYDYLGPATGRAISGAWGALDWLFRAADVGMLAIPPPGLVRGAVERIMGIDR